MYINVNNIKNINQDKIFREVFTMLKLNSKYIVRYITCWIENNDNFKIHHQDQFNSDSELSEISKESISNSQISNDSESFSAFGIEIQRSKNQSTQIKMEKENMDKFFQLQLYIQMDFCNENLKQYLQNRMIINRRQNLEFFTQIIKGLQHIHEIKIIHRDLKPDNIFITQQNNEKRIKIGDFGLAREEDGAFKLKNLDNFSNSDKQTLSTGLGTPLYIPPEQNKGDYNEKVDIYASGIILLELCSNFKTAHERLIVLQNFRNRQELPANFESRFGIESKIIKKLCNNDPKRRPSAQEVLNGKLMRSWINQIEKL